MLIKPPYFPTVKICPFILKDRPYTPFQTVAI